MILTLSPIRCWLLVVFALLVLAGLFDIKRQTQRILANQDTVIAQGNSNEKQLLSFMARTVDRWDKLQRDNPEITVPRVTEPLVAPHVGDDQMRRPVAPPPSP